MSLTSKIDLSRQLITFTAIGKISSNEIIEIIKSFYEKQPSNKVIWDFRYVGLEAPIFSSELESIASSIFKTSLKLQKVGETAIVASTDMWFSFARMYAKFAEVENLLHIIRIFRFIDEAIKWLDCNTRTCFPRR